MEHRLNQYKKRLKKNHFLYDLSEGTEKECETLGEKTYALTFAPVIFSYVTWILHEAYKKKIQRLYFLARDAKPMYEVAKFLKENNLLGFDIDIRYLRVSRYSLRIPEYHLQNEKCLDRIFLSGIDVSLYRILKRADLTVDEMKQVSKELGYEKELHVVLNRKQILQLKEKAYELSHEGKLSLLKFIHTHSKQRFETTIGYLEQEGMLDDVSYAVVDSGWVGSIQKSLQNLLATKKPGIPLEGYYFGLYELPIDIKDCVYHTYYFKPTSHIRRKTGFSNCLFEAIYSENCGMVKNYEKSETGFYPVLSDLENPNAKSLKQNEAVLNRYLNQVKQHPNEYRLFLKKQQKRNVKIIEKVLNLLMSRPTDWEASYYGDYLFSDDLDDTHMKKTANILSQKEIKDLRILSKILISLGISKKVIHESAWIEGTIVNGEENVKKNLFFARYAKLMTYLRLTIKMKKIRGYKCLKQ
ncbi:MAG: hypothetical protein K5675_00525 [Lachnospiraceae bacterium]|nr:hypothetical protein [Lachnospiraceae bacterium]